VLLTGSVMCWVLVTRPWWCCWMRSVCHWVRSWVPRVPPTVKTGTVPGTGKGLWGGCGRLGHRGSAGGSQITAAPPESAVRGGSAHGGSRAGRTSHPGGDRR